MNHFAVLTHKLSGLSLTDFMSGRDKLSGKPHHPRLRYPFDEAMVLLNQGIEVLDLPQLTTFRDDSRCFEFIECFGVSSMFVHVDHPWSTALRGGKRFEQEAFGRFRISGWTEQEIERISPRVNRTIEIHPLFFDPAPI